MSQKTNLNITNIKVYILKLTKFVLKIQIILKVHWHFISIKRIIKRLIESINSLLEISIKNNWELQLGCKIDFKVHPYLLQAVTLPYIVLYDFHFLLFKLTSIWTKTWLSNLIFLSTGFFLVIPKRSKSNFFKPIKETS